MTEHGSHTSGVDHSVHGLTQLRVHGVSGTPAAAMLAHPPDLLERECGDRRAGFYRRWYPGGTSPDSDAGRLEAYSWGGLTSGPASRALWLLFLPFVLVDLAHWMLPPLAAGRPDRSARLASSTLRLVALSLTPHVPPRHLGGDPRPRCLAVRAQPALRQPVRAARLDLRAGPGRPARRGRAGPGRDRRGAVAARPAGPATAHGDPPPGPEVQPTGRPLADPDLLERRRVRAAAARRARGRLELGPGRPRPGPDRCRRRATTSVAPSSRSCSCSTSACWAPASGSPAPSG